MHFLINTYILLIHPKRRMSYIVLMYIRCARIKTSPLLLLELIYLQFGGLKHLYTLDVGFLYAGILAASTYLTSPGPNERSLCLRHSTHIKHKYQDWRGFNSKIMLHFYILRTRLGVISTFEGQVQVSQLAELSNYQNLETRWSRCLQSTESRQWTWVVLLVQTRRPHSRLGSHH